MEKKAIAVLAAVIFSIGLPPSVYAECYEKNESPAEMQEMTNDNSGISAVNLYSDVSNDSEVNSGRYTLTYPMQRGVSLPTEKHDLTKGNYTANIEQLGARWLYTNKFFYSSSSGRLYVKYSVKTISANGYRMAIGVYDLTTDTSYTDFETDYLPSNGSYLNGQMYFSGLNPDHQYAVMFGSVSEDGTIGIISGTAEIGQSRI